MADPRVIRTFSILGADGAGKTALVEALLRVADATPRSASPASGFQKVHAREQNEIVTKAFE